eukprot:scaffold846_cov168-Amphora_coffeaeformis.AAC.28
MAEFHNLKSFNDEEPEDWKELNRAAEALTKEAPTADMPSLDHLNRADYNQVYEPAEDTYLLIDALLYEFEQGVFDSNTASNTADDDDFVLLEIGCGTGVPTIMFRQEWQKRYPNRKLRTYVTDINPRALEVALRTDECNNNKGGDTSLAPIQVVHCDLGTDLLETLAGSVDVLIFNPPYVVTPDEEVVDFSNTNTTTGTATDDSIIAAAWAGGIHGRRVTDRALPQIQHVLRGHAYLITVDDNQPANLAVLCQKDHQLGVQPLFRRRAQNEYLTVQKIHPLE